MGKAITKAEYDKARASMRMCKTPDCRNSTGNPSDSPCLLCIAAHKLCRKYEKSNQLEADR